VAEAETLAEFSLADSPRTTSAISRGDEVRGMGRVADRTFDALYEMATCW